MISADKLNELKKLFAEDGIVLDDQQALEIGLWLISQVQPFVKPVPLDKLALLEKIRKQMEVTLRQESLVNLGKWRRNHVKNQAIDVSNRLIPPQDR